MTLEIPTEGGAGAPFAGPRAKVPVPRAQLCRGAPAPWARVDGEGCLAYAAPAHWAPCKTRMSPVPAGKTTSRSPELHLSLER